MHVVPSVFVVASHHRVVGRARYRLAKMLAALFVAATLPVGVLAQETARR